MEITYRKAKLEDLETISRFWDKLDKTHIRYHPLYRLEDNILEKRKKYIKKQIERRDAFIYLAEGQGRIIGFADGRVEDRAPILKIKKIGCLAAVFVEKKYRKRGIGGRLVENLIGEFKKRDLNFVKAEIDVRNSSAFEFYREFGFEKFKSNIVKEL